jgi:hypothetical protein
MGGGAGSGGGGARRCQSLSSALGAIMPAAPIGSVEPACTGDLAGVAPLASNSSMAGSAGPVGSTDPAGSPEVVGSAALAGASTPEGASFPAVFACRSSRVGARRPGSLQSNPLKSFMGVLQPSIQYKVTMRCPDISGVDCRSKTAHSARSDILYSPRACHLVPRVHRVK